MTRDAKTVKTAYHTAFRGRPKEERTPLKKWARAFRGTGSDMASIKGWWRGKKHVPRVRAPRVARTVVPVKKESSKKKKDQK